MIPFLTPSLGAQSPTPVDRPLWISAHAGFGPVGTLEMRNEPLYGGGEVVMHYAVVWGVAPRRAYAVEVLRGYAFGLGDKVGPLTPTPPIRATGVDFWGVSADVLTTFARAIGPDEHALGAGLGLYRTTGAKSGTPRLVPGLQLLAEVPIIAPARVGVMFGVRGIALVGLHGQIAALGLVSAGINMR
jgi:hypothetical protein